MRWSDPKPQPRGSKWQGPPPCVCGRRMNLRFNRRTGQAFYGCTGYPACKRTAPADVQEPDWWGKRAKR